MSSKIFGIVPPMVTPFNDQEALDETALQADVEYLISEAGAHGLAVGGSTGEGHTLTTDELRRAVGTAVGPLPQDQPDQHPFWQQRSTLLY